MNTQVATSTPTNNPPATGKGGSNKPQANKEPKKAQAPAKSKDVKATPAPAAKKADPAPASNASKASFKLSAVITNIAANPHRVGSKDHDRFKAYKEGMTVEQAMEKGVRRVDINWHAQHKHIKVSSK